MSENSAIGNLPLVRPSETIQVESMGPVTEIEQSMDQSDNMDQEEKMDDDSTNEEEMEEV